jgi:phage head maturation protease
VTASEDRRLLLRCVPFGVATTVVHETTGETIRERFGGPWAFAGVDPDRVQLRFRHLPSPVGQVLRLMPTKEHLVAHVDVTDESAWLLWRSGGLPGVSIGFVPVVDHWVVDRDTGQPVLERIKVDLTEISLVDTPAYRDAKVCGRLVDVEREKLRLRMRLDAARRDLGLPPLPRPAPSSSTPSAPRTRPTTTTTGIRYTAATGRVLAVH